MEHLLQKLDAVLAGADAAILSDENIKGQFWIWAGQGKTEIIEKILKLPQENILPYQALVKGLKMAAYHGSTETVAKILELAMHKIKKYDISGASFEASNIHKETVLKISELAGNKVDGSGISKVITSLVRNGNTKEALEILESYKDRVSKENHPDVSPAFHHCAQVGDAKTLKKLWEFSEGNISTYTIEDSLGSATSNGDVKIMKQLLEWAKNDETYGAEWAKYSIGAFKVANMLKIAAVDGDLELIEELMNYAAAPIQENTGYTGAIILGLRSSSEYGRFDSMLKIWELGKDAILNKPYMYETQISKNKIASIKGNFNEKTYEVLSVALQEVSSHAKCAQDENITCPVQEVLARDIFAEAIAYAE
jgi:hypothetical protein